MYEIWVPDCSIRMQLHNLADSTKCNHKVTYILSIHTVDFYLLIAPTY